MNSSARPKREGVPSAEHRTDARHRRLRERIAKPITHASSNPPARSERERPTLTIPEAAWALNISVETAYRNAKRGDLPGAFRFGRRWVVSREAFNRFLQNPTK